MKRFNTFLSLANKIALVAIFTLVFGLTFSTASNTVFAGDKVTICHATDSATNPYVKETISVAAAYNSHILKEHTGPVWSAELPVDTRWGDIVPSFKY